VIRLAASAILPVKHQRCVGAVTLCILFAACASVPARLGSESGSLFLSSPADEWITIRDFRWVAAVGVSERVAYFGTTAGLERWDTLRQTWLAPLTEADDLPDDYVTALVAEPLGGDVWVGTRRGLARLSGFDDLVEPVWGPLPAPVETLLLDPRDGAVYARIAGTWWSGRSASFSRVAAPPTGPLEGSAEAAELDPARVPWIDPLYARGAYEPGLFRLTEVDRDLRGDWYAGTSGDNARRWRTGAADWEPLLFGLAGPSGGPMARAADGYWFAPAAGDGDGTVALVHAAPDLGSWSHVVPREVPELPVATATALIAIADTLVVGSDFGIAWGIGPGWASSGHADVGRVAALAVDGPVLWIGTDDGLLAWDRSARRSVGTVLRARGINAIVAAPDALFVGAADGLWAARRIGPPATTAEARAVADSLIRVEPRGRAVRALALHGNLLLLASDLGVDVFDRASGAWTSFPIGVGRLVSAPLALASDGENVWIGTERGLVRWRIATNEWRDFGPGDGLAGVPVLHLLAERDFVWASTPAGVSRFAWRAAGP
jgi:hypothetical protein